MYKRSKLITFLKKVFRKMKQLNEAQKSYMPAFRILTVVQDKDGEHEVVVQLINKSTKFKIKPEKLLADDTLVNQFPPCDIRTITYLGYLGINNPKYKILAKQLSENQDQMIFALHKKGEKNYIVKTANEISADNEIIQSLSQIDAHMIGFTSATEQLAIEKLYKKKLTN